MAKRLTPERLAKLLAHVPLDLIEHLDVTEEMLNEAALGLLRAGGRINTLQDELAEAKARIAHLEDQHVPVDDPIVHGD